MWYSILILWLFLVTVNQIRQNSNFTNIKQESSRMANQTAGNLEKLLLLQKFVQEELDYIKEISDAKIRVLEDELELQQK